MILCFWDSGFRRLEELWCLLFHRLAVREEFSGTTLQLKRRRISEDSSLQPHNREKRKCRKLLDLRFAKKLRISGQAERLYYSLEVSPMS
jgi:hypothetical protein